MDCLRLFPLILLRVGLQSDPHDSSYVLRTTHVPYKFVLIMHMNCEIPMLKFGEVISCEPGNSSPNSSLPSEGWVACVRYTEKHLESTMDSEKTIQLLSYKDERSQRGDLVPVAFCMSLSKSHRLGVPSLVHNGKNITSPFRHQRENYKKTTKFELEVLKSHHFTNFF
jgi:hypothetical protein